MRVVSVLSYGVSPAVHDGWGLSLPVVRMVNTKSCDITAQSDRYCDYKWRSSNNHLLHFAVMGVGSPQALAVAAECGTKHCGGDYWSGACVVRFPSPLLCINYFKRGV